MPRYDAEWIASLQGDERVRVTRPRELLRAAGARPGATVVDYGSGPGFLTIPAARMVGPSGRAIGVDVEPRMRRYLVEQARAGGLGNVEAIDPETARRLPDGVADVVSAALFLHDLSLAERERLVAELRRLCAPAGGLLVVEWVAPGGLAGPPTDNRFSARQLAALLRRNGFEPGRPRLRGDQYFAVVGRPAEVSVPGGALPVVAARPRRDAER